MGDGLHAGGVTLNQKSSNINWAIMFAFSLIPLQNVLALLFPKLWIKLFYKNGDNK